jgi:hypothetical protein
MNRLKVVDRIQMVVDVSSYKKVYRSSIRSLKEEDEKHYEQREHRGESRSRG